MMAEQIFTYCQSLQINILLRAWIFLQVTLLLSLVASNAFKMTWKLLLTRVYSLLDSNT